MDELSTASQLAGQASHDLSLWGLFLQADIVVKGVMLLLIAASIWCWAIIFEKGIRMRRLHRAADRFEENFWSGGSLEELYERTGRSPSEPMSAVFGAGMREWQISTETFAADGAPQPGAANRLERVMGLTLAREMADNERGMTFLASVGSTAPFIGLFGTVWGIMNSFTAIAGAQNATLAVVAPGIAEALFATALGLFAAIPATAAYNKFTNDLGKYAERLESFAVEFGAILGRHLEERT